MGRFAEWLHRRPDGTEPSAGPNGPNPTNTARRTTSPEHLTAESLDQFLRDHPRAVVDVWAPWCGPCRAFAPVFSAAARQWGADIGFGKIHADREPELVARFVVRSIPSLLFFRNGEVVRTEVGVVPPDRLDRRLHRVFPDLR